jgi:hypothetical protein
MKTRLSFISRASKCQNYITIALKTKDQKRPFDLPQKKNSKAIRKQWGSYKNENPSKSS